MNCRTDNCPNPVPHLDELCAACREEPRVKITLLPPPEAFQIDPPMSFLGRNMPPEAPRACEKCGATENIDWLGFDSIGGWFVRCVNCPTELALRARKDWGGAPEGAVCIPLGINDAGPLCHQPSLCGQRFMGKADPSSGSVSLPDGTWFCSEDCKKRRGRTSTP